MKELNDGSLSGGWGESLGTLEGGADLCLAKDLYIEGTAI